MLVISPKASKFIHMLLISSSLSISCWSQQFYFVYTNIVYIDIDMQSYSICTSELWKGTIEPTKLDTECLSRPDWLRNSFLFSSPIGRTFINISPKSCYAWNHHQLLPLVRLIAVDSLFSRLAIPPLTSEQWLADKRNAQKVMAGAGRYPKNETNSSWTCCEWTWRMRRLIYPRSHWNAILKCST